MHLTRSKLPALMLLMTLLSSIFVTGCGGTKTIQQRNGQISVAAEDKDLEVYVKDANGVRVKAKGTIHTGDYIVPDAAVPEAYKKAVQPNQPAPAAPKSQTPVSVAPAGEVLIGEVVELPVRIAAAPVHVGEVLLMKT